MSSEQTLSEHTRYLTTQGFVDFINAEYGLGLTRSRLAKDRMRQEDGSPGIAPEPIAWFGNRALFSPSQAPSYVQRLVTKDRPSHPEPQRNTAA